MARFATLIALLLAVTTVQATMKFKTLTGAFLLSLMLVASGAAQQDPLDLGEADKAFFVISEPTVGAVEQLVSAELYFFHDVQNIANMSFAFGWDNPNLLVDSIDWSPAAKDAFDLAKLWLYRGSIDSCNANQLFQCTGMRMSGYGLEASSELQLVATYFFSCRELAAYYGGSGVCH